MDLSEIRLSWRAAYRGAAWKPGNRDGLAVLLALVHGVHSEIARLALRIGSAPLGNGDRTPAGALYANPPPAVRGRTAQVGQKPTAQRVVGTPASDRRCTRASGFCTAGPLKSSWAASTSAKSAMSEERQRRGKLGRRGGSGRTCRVSLHRPINRVTCALLRPVSLSRYARMVEGVKQIV
jgi:hypothetical protein